LIAAQRAILPVPEDWRRGRRFVYCLKQLGERRSSMPREVIRSDKLPKSFGAFEMGGIKVRDGWILFVSGQCAVDENFNLVGKGDIKVQTRKTLENIKSVVEEAGGTLNDVVKVTVYVRDMSHLKAIHDVRFEYFTKNLPASTLVEVSRLINDDYLIEIDAVAFIQDT
jgi:reactive intermediate/imine deaminase